jgi:Acyl-CoA carboxylase epsilon subunit
VSEAESRTPLVVVRGDATAEEVAALVAVLQASAAARSPGRSSRRPPREWSAHRRRVRAAQLVPPSGPAAWRASGLPH